MRLRMLSLVFLTFLTSCLDSPDIRVSSARLLQAKTLVSDDAGNQVSAVGYLLLSAESDTDLAKSAAAHEAEIWYSAETCDSHVKMGGWPYIYPTTSGSYQLLIGYKSSKGAQYNLATHPEDVCITVGIGSMNPLSNARSKVLKYSLSESLREGLRSDELGGGAVEFQLSPDCKEHMCRPRYRKKG